MNRRSLLVGAASLVAAPAVVRAGSLMQISGTRYEAWQWRCPILPPLPIRDGEVFSTEGYLGPNGRLYEGTWTLLSEKGKRSIHDEVLSFTKREYPPTPVALGL